MAKQAGDIFIEGTLDDLTFYKMDGEYYVRMKSSLTGQKFWKHKAFERSRESCNRFAEGNKLASKVYRMIEEDKRVYKLFCFLKKRAILLLKEGKRLADAEAVLLGYLNEFGVLPHSEKQYTRGRTKDVVREAAKKKLYLQSKREIDSASIHGSDEYGITDVACAGTLFNDS